MEKQKKVTGITTKDIIIAVLMVICVGLSTVIYFRIDHWNRMSDNILKPIRISDMESAKVGKFRATYVVTVSVTKNGRGEVAGIKAFPLSGAEYITGQGQ